ncbi:MAG: chromosome segregation protein SMC [Candidatus Bathyarchaeia archaeon]
MYIKRIDLRGFKTFGKKATVHFDRGLTIITGPNGSGKSNILDSVKFALGELSAKELRGETIGDLIHKGVMAATSRSAWVAVQFDNQDRRIPVDAEAVTISREFRRGGEGIYRLNGRKVSRKQLTDILSSADIQVSSYNIVPQHAITRLAEVTTEERRTIIEDMIGIAVYDTKKNSAQVELQKADVNLQVASAKIEEVRLRVESLERERNDYLKYKQIQNEINGLQAKAISHKIKKAQQENSELEQDLSKHQQQLQELKAGRDQVVQEKTKLESEKREYEETVADKGSSRLLEVQRKMGDVNATIAGLQARANAAQSNIKSLQDQKSELEKNSTEILQKVNNSKNEIAELRSSHTALLQAIEAKQAKVDESFKALTDLRDKLGARNKEAEDLERTIGSLTSRVARFTSQVKASATKIDLLNNHLKTLRTRKQEYENALQNAAKHVDELLSAKDQEGERPAEADKKISEYVKIKQQLAQDAEKANEVAKRSALELTEIETQKNVTENLASDDKALSLIEQMAEAGAVSGVYGRLADLVKVKDDYGKAAQAAAAGWMKALVVRNIQAALSCIEVLKKTKVGRVKLIPLEGLTPPKKVYVPKGIQEIIGPITDSLEFAERVRPAVNYVFGDTLLTSNQKSAFLASLKGVRAVAVSGDLYEPGGAMETGYFRQPLDVSKLLLKGKTIDHLRTTLSSLEKLAVKAKEEIVRIDQEILDRRNSKMKSQNLIRSIEREIVTLKGNLERAHKIIEDTSERIEQITHEVGTEQTVLEASVSQKEKIQPKLAEFEQTRSSLRIRSQSAVLLERENEHSTLTSELTDLVRQKIEAESRIESLTSTVTAIEPTAQQTKIQSTGIDRQLEKLASELPFTQTELSKNEEQLKQLAAARDQLTQELAGVRVKRDEYNSRLREMDAEINELFGKLDPLNNKIANLTASLKHTQMQTDFHMNELKELGYPEAVEVSDDEIQKVETTLPVLKKELAGIGGVNELAASQYEEVKENYKHLATRIYELEKEKMSIVQFMNELDQRKLEAFMKAFNQVSESFSQIFSTVTSGAGRLFLEKSENPFEGGADIRLQFPGKTEMSIGSASGGEKSVGTVCFILSLQAIHPMPFYMMDEIDAHLDVVNSQRLAELLKSKSKGSQFIVVSLKDVTIARADAVYGVFIQEGVSQVVGLPMQEVRTVGRTQ